MMGAFFHTFSLLNERHLEEVSLVCDSQDTGSAGRIYGHHRLNQFGEGVGESFSGSWRTNIYLGGLLEKVSTGMKL